MVPNGEGEPVWMTPHQRVSQPEGERERERERERDTVCSFPRVCLILSKNNYAFLVADNLIGQNFTLCRERVPVIQ